MTHHVDFETATARLRVTEAHFRLLVESVRDYAIFLLDPEGHVTSWNLGAERAKGYAASEIIGSHFSRFYPEEDVRAGKCEMELVAAARDGRFEDEGWRKRKDGTYFWANVVITALRDESGTLIGYAKVTRDLSERKRAEEEKARLFAEQKAREAADAANRAKDDFLAHVSHELRTPLNAILGWARLHGTLDEGKRARAMKTIERNADAMRQLIDDLLDVSRIISGRMRLEIGHVDLALLTERVIESVKVSADAKGVHVSASLDTGIVVVADESRLQQIVSNLLTNAIKFTSRGGRISVTARRIDASAEIVVEDTGIGISAVALPHVFDPFWQEAPSSGGSRGLGLGLAICRKLIELHGGTIDARSGGKGHGATFIATIPAVRASAAASSQRRANCTSESRLDGVRVLVVEDDEDAREFVGEYLAVCGASVTMAADATEALDTFRRAPPDVLVSDIGLPGEDGYSLMRRIRALPADQGGRVPAIAMTAYARADDRVRVLSAGFAVYLPKPLDPTELAMVIAALAGFPREGASSN